MAADQSGSGSLSPRGGGASVTIGDVPDAIRRRYYLDREAGRLAFYEDAQIRIPAFRDRGKVLTVDRSTPRNVRDMTAIAQHRGWRVVEAKGSQTFRREAWLEGRRAGLEVRGYRPTARDLQALERQSAARTPDPSERRRARGGTDIGRDPQAQARFEVLAKVVRSRVADVDAQDRILARARHRIADWLERGAQFRPPPERRRAVEAQADVASHRERRR